MRIRLHPHCTKRYSAHKRPQWVLSRAERRRQRDKENEVAIQTAVDRMKAYIKALEAKALLREGA